MGRVKLKIKRLESSSSRQVTYSKRRSGILKKAQELSVLCDIDIMLLMFSPTGKPTLFCGERSDIDDIIGKFAQLTPQERAKRRVESLEVLRKTFKKLDHDLEIQQHSEKRTPSVEELCNQMTTLRSRLAEVHKRLSWWNNPDQIEDFDQLNLMEDSLRKSLDRIHMYKQENSVKHQSVSMDCANQNGMHMPLMMGVDQQPESLSWHPKNENQLMTTPDKPNFGAERYMEHCADMSLPSCSGFFCDMKKPGIDNTGADSGRLDDNFLENFSSISCLRPQINPQYMSHPYNGFNWLEANKLESDKGFAPQENQIAYQPQSNFELPRSFHGSVDHSWVPPPGACSMTMFDETPYNQPQDHL